MGKVRVAAYTVSLDGFGAGKGQALDTPMGRGAEQLHAWMFATRRMKEMMGVSGGEAADEADERFVEASFENVGAWIMGRNMFGPIRGPWPDESWRGWWGETPPYHCDVFVLTHHERAPLEMNGGTVFHFVTDGPEAALERAQQSAKGKDVRIGGGAETIRDYLGRGLIDELHIAVSPVLLGSGEPLFAVLDLKALGYDVVETAPSSKALHVRIERGQR